MRLIRFLASAGVASRRKCEAIVRSGRVEVNGETERDPFRIISGENLIVIDGEIIAVRAERTVFLLHKPAGVITTAEDTHGRKTVVDLISITDRRLFPVGRLDKETTGVLLLTDDGDLAYRLTHPKFGVKKIYEATADRRLSQIEEELIASGIDIGEGDIGRAQVIGQKSDDDGIRISLKLYHGKKREVRRIMKAVGIHLRHLHRSVFAGITLGDLSVGESRPLSAVEARFLQGVPKSLGSL
ncbi:MAG: pseudouridine synthase [Candidatus Neomarinimicrobiota bacterium]|nr:pseudouridine synthase [Candidatus Neomarinimicrobiota bacterium]